MNSNEDLKLVKTGAARPGECPGRLDMLEKLVGQPADEHTKSLYDIVIALNKEILSLKEEIEQMKDDADRESKKLQDEIERRRGEVRWLDKQEKR